MHRFRFSIAGLMAAVAVSALAAAALRSPSAAWAGAMLLLLWGVLGLAIAGALFRKGSERSWWVGFALFGCGYAVLAFWSDSNTQSLPTTTLLLFLHSKFDPSAAATPHWTFLQIAHCLWALLAAIAGGALVRVLFGGGDREELEVETHSAAQLPVKWWRRPAVIWLTGLALIGSAALVGSRSAPGSGPASSSS